MLIVVPLEPLGVVKGKILSILVKGYMQSIFKINWWKW